MPLTYIKMTIEIEKNAHNQFYFNLLENYFITGKQ